MWMPDVNVRVYAHRADDPSHAWYQEWLQRAVRGPEPLALSVLVLGGFVRVVTHPRAFRNPTPLPVALAAVETLIARARVVAPGPRHVSLFTHLCREAGATGKRVADAQHAAVAIEHGCRWATRDRDFAAFEPHGLRWEHLTPRD